jgi:hypothetical protein
MYLCVSTLPRGARLVLRTTIHALHVIIIIIIIVFTLLPRLHAFRPLPLSTHVLQLQVCLGKGVRLARWVTLRPT